MNRSPDDFPLSAKPAIELQRLDSDALRVLVRLRKNQFVAYLVGGCVRDLLLDRAPKDFDIATNATPEQLKRLFRNCRLIGQRFRLTHLYFRGGKILEVSTFRAMPHLTGALQKPGDFAPLRKTLPSRGEPALGVGAGAGAGAAYAGGARKAQPDLLIVEDNTFGTAIEDARRRDFTINGLFYDPIAGKVIDYVGGLSDLQRLELRTIGNPEVRMREDPIRILRAVRFAAKLGFEIEPQTYAAMEAALEDLPRCAPPRLLEETFRLLRGGHAAQALKLLDALGALRLLLAPVAEYLVCTERSAEYWRCIASLDARIHAGTACDDSMVLAGILLPIVLDGFRQEAPSTMMTVELLLSQLLCQARLPRRIAERTRMILTAQRTLAGLKRSRRRGGLLGFRRHPLFHEALALFETWVVTTGQYRAALSRWKVGGVPLPLPNASGPRRRRRRKKRPHKRSAASS